MRQYQGGGTRVVATAALLDDCAPMGRRGGNEGYAHSSFLSGVPREVRESGTMNSLKLISSL